MSECPIVQTHNGKVKGRLSLKAKPKEAKQVYNYPGIPFAKPPVGELRFEPPQKCGAWEGVLTPKHLGVQPMQNLEILEKQEEYFGMINAFEDKLDLLDEDCLYLSVHTTNPVKTANMPVMVWLYGGGFQFGGSTLFDGQALCGLNDVVLVVPNYRVNVFGFFTTGKDTAYPGNMGMLDQIMALEWVRDNIEQFGGNPNNVTIFGQSAGSMSVGVHMLSPMSKSLFHKAIQHSGTADFPALVKDNCTSELKTYLETLKITETEPQAIVKKLKALSAKDVLEGLKAKDSTLMFSVQVDGRILQDNPKTLIESGRLAAVPSIVGCNNTEGSGIVTGSFPPSFARGYTEEEWTKETKPSLPYAALGKTDKEDKVFEAVKSTYEKEFSDDDKFKWSKISGAIGGDTMFVVSSLDQTLAHANSGNTTYMYMMTQRLMCHHDDEYAIELNKKAEFCECDHVDDVRFTFGQPLMNGKKTKQMKYSEDEEKFSLSWMTYLANFATTGNPNNGKKVLLEWSTFDKKQQRYLTAQIPFAEENHPIPERYKLWKETIPSL